MLHEVGTDELLVGIHADGHEFIDDPEEHEGGKNSLRSSLVESYRDSKQTFLTQHNKHSAQRL